MMSLMSAQKPPSSSFLLFRRLSENLFVGGVGVPALSGPIRAGHVVRPGDDKLRRRRRRLHFKDIGRDKEETAKKSQRKGRGEEVKRRREERLEDCKERWRFCGST